MIELHSQPRRSPHVLARQVKPDEGTMVLLHPRSGEYYSLDEVGARIWGLCDGTNTIAHMISILSQEYDAPAEVLGTDVCELLTDLAHEQLVEGLS
jgi:hypothetical protein